MPCLCNHFVTSRLSPTSVLGSCLSDRLLVTLIKSSQKFFSVYASISIFPAGSSETLYTIGNTSSSPWKTVRYAPAVNVLLPPTHEDGAFSRTNTLPVDP